MLCDAAVKKINIYTICRATESSTPMGTVGIALSRVTGEDGRQTHGAWIISEALDLETGWDSLNLIGDRLRDGADDFYILNFTRLARHVDDLVDQALGG